MFGLAKHGVCQITFMYKFLYNFFDLGTPTPFFSQLGGRGLNKKLFYCIQPYKNNTVRSCQTMTLLSLYKHDPNLGVVGGQAKHFELFYRPQVP